MDVALEPFKTGSFVVSRSTALWSHLFAFVQSLALNLSPSVCLLSSGVKGRGSEVGERACVLCRGICFVVQFHVSAGFTFELFSIIFPSLSVRVAVALSLFCF